MTPSSPPASPANSVRGSRKSHWRWGDGGAVGGDVDKRVLDVRALVVEVERAREDGAFEARRVVAGGPDGDVRAFAAEDHGGVAQVRAALPATHFDGVAGGGESFAAEVRADEERVAINPADLGFRFGEFEAAERAGGEVEFAHDDRVRPAARQPDERAVVCVGTHGRAFEHPVFRFVRSELIDVQ